MNDSSPITDEQRNKALLVHFVSMLGASALQQMGKLVNPATGRAEVDLEGAQSTIDLLDMLEAKTRGNLDPEEERVLRDVLMSAKLTFVETMQGAPPAPGPAAGGPPAEPAVSAAAERGEGAPSPDGGDAAPADEAKRKFHKKYG